jgi:hypothetical protein
MCCRPFQSLLGPRSFQEIPDFLLHDSGSQTNAQSAAGFGQQVCAAGIVRELGSVCVEPQLQGLATEAVHCLLGYPCKGRRCSYIRTKKPISANPATVIQWLASDTITLKIITFIAAALL